MAQSQLCYFCRRPTQRWVRFGYLMFYVYCCARCA